MKMLVEETVVINALKRKILDQKALKENVTFSRQKKSVFAAAD